MALDGDIWWASHPHHFISGKTAHSTHRVGGWLGHATGMDILVKIWIYCSCWNWNSSLPNYTLVTILNILQIILPMYNLFTPSPCLMPVSFNAPCQITQVFNLHFLTFGLMLCSIMLTPYFWRDYHLWYTLTVAWIQQHPANPATMTHNTG
jgi:hypothetical protein